MAGRVCLLVFLLLSLTICARAVDADLYGKEDFSGRTVLDDAIERLNKNPKKTRTWSKEDFMAGPNRFTLTVVDAATGKPVKDFIVHADMSIYQLPEGNAGDPEKVLVGRLESKRVSDPAGRCVYDNLRNVTVSFHVWADGYVPRATIVRIDSDVRKKEVRLKRAAAIHGRVVAKGGKPIEGMAVELRYDWEKHSDDQYEDKYATRTDRDGRFAFDSVPRDKYDLDLEGLQSIREKQDQLAFGKYDPSLPENRSPQFLREHYFMLQKAEIDLTHELDCDLGNWELEPDPILDLELVDERNHPLPNYPFHLQFHRGNSWSDNIECTSGDNGKALIPLIKSMPGGEVAVFAPRRLERFYKIPESESGEKVFDEQEFLDNFAEQQGIEFDTHAKPGDLSPRLRKRYAKELSEAKAEKIAERKAYLALPDHPNVRVLKPAPGELCQVRMVCHPLKEGASIRIAARDRETSRPIQNVTAVLSEGSSLMALQILSDFNQALKKITPKDAWVARGNSAGELSFPMFTPSADLLQKELEKIETERKNPKANYGPQYLDMYLFAHANGYADQTFDFPLATARSGRLLSIAMEPEARVRGRVLLADSKEPITSASLKACLERAGKWNANSEQAWRNRYIYWENPALRLLLMNPSVETIANPGRMGHFVSVRAVELGPDGRFEIRGLRPGAHWVASLEHETLARIRVGEITLKPGDNELNDILVPLPGVFNARVTDETGRPVEGALVGFPGGGGMDPGEASLTKSGGEIQLPLDRLERGERQIVRIVPPWGMLEKNIYTHVFDATMTLTRSAADRFDARIHRGNTLVINVPATAARAELVRYYADPAKWQTGYGREQHPRFALRGAQVQGLEPNESGLRDAIEFVLPDNGLLFTSDTMTMRIEHVPPGRHAICLMGGVYAERYFYRMKNPPPPAEFNGVQCEPVPIGYAEFDMRETTTTLELEVSAASLQINMTGYPASPRSSPIAIIERVGPSTSYLGNDWIRAVMHKGSPTGDPLSFSIPMIGYFAGFDGSLEPPAPAVPIFRSIPSGTWRIRTYTDFQDLALSGALPYDERTIEIAPNAKARVTIPYRPRALPESVVR